MKKNGVMRRNEFPRCELGTCLAASSPHIAVFGLAIPHLHHHLVFTIENTHLTIQIGADHPLALGVEVAGHAHVLLVFDCLHVSAVQCEGLNPSVAAVSHGQKRLFSASVNPEAM